MTFEANEPRATLRILTEDDDVDESNGDVEVTIFRFLGSLNENRFRLRENSTQISEIVFVNDNDTRGVTVTGSPVAVDEGSTATYSVVLTSEPTADVTVTPESGNTAAVTVSDALTFTPDNWDTAQTVTVTGVADADTDDETVTITHDIAGGDYGPRDGGRRDRKRDR